MRTDLARLLDLHRGVLPTSTAATAGVTGDELTRALAAGEVRRVRRGLYADAAVWDPAPPWERYRLTVTGVLLGHPTWVASHHAALVLHGIVLHGTDLGHVDVAAGVATSTRRLGLHVHRLGDDPPGLLHATPRALPVGMACALTAAVSGVQAGVVLMDAALHGGRCRRADLVEALGHPGCRVGIARARAAVAAADGSSESPGESRTRLLLASLEVTVRPQVDLHDDRGFVGRVDLLVGERVVVEFDGLTKYAGADGPQALAAEKRREDRLREAGYRVVRLTWVDLAHPERALARVRAALAAAAA